MFWYLHTSEVSESILLGKKKYVCPLGSLFSYAYELETVFKDFNKIAIIWVK